MSYKTYAGETVKQQGQKDKGDEAKGRKESAGLSGLTNLRYLYSLDERGHTIILYTEARNRHSPKPPDADPGKSHNHTNPH